MNSSDNALDFVTERFVKLFPFVYPLFRNALGSYDEYQILYLQILRSKGGHVSRPEFWKFLDLDTKMASNLLKPLQDKGLIRLVSWGGRNGRVDEITSKGNEEFERIRDRIKILIKQLLALADQAEVRTFIKLLEKWGSSEIG